MRGRSVVLVIVGLLIVRVARVVACFLYVYAFVIFLLLICTIGNVVCLCCCVLITCDWCQVFIFQSFAFCDSVA
jgi:hypothetical protein